MHHVRVQVSADNLFLAEPASHVLDAQVGGDGLFQEVMNGVLALRREGGPRAVVAENLRLGQIPAGSTDAVTWSINGTRSVEAAALHVALGDG